MDNALDTAYGRMLTVEAFLDGGLSLDAVCDRLRDVWDVPEPVKYLAQRMAARPHTGFRSSLTLTRFGATEGTTGPYRLPMTLDDDFNPDVRTVDDQGDGVLDCDNPHALMAARNEALDLAAKINSFRRRGKAEGWGEDFVTRVTSRWFARADELLAEFGRDALLNDETPLISEYRQGIESDLIAWIHRHDPEVEVDAETAKVLGFEDSTEFSSIRAMRREDWVERRTAERRVELRSLMTLYLGEGWNGRSEIVTEWAKSAKGRWYPKTKVTVAALYEQRVAKKDGDVLAGLSSMCFSIRKRLLSKGDLSEKEIDKVIAEALRKMEAHDFTTASGLA